LTIGNDDTDTQSVSLNGGAIIKIKSLSRRFYLPRISTRSLKEIIKKADVVHLMCHWTIINAWVFLITWKLKKPYVICPAGALRIYGRSKILKTMYNLVIGKKMLRNANALIAITKDEIKDMIHLGVDSSKITVISNGVSEEDFKVENDGEFRKKHAIGKNPILLFVGRLNRIKGPDILLKSFCAIKDRFKEYHVVIAGPDEGMLAELQNIVAMNALGDRVHFIGSITGADKSEAFYCADLLAIPSRQEAMSIVVLEAGITGTPVLISDQCGFADISSVGGGLIVPASVEGFQYGLERMLQDKKALIEMGKRLKDHVKKNYSWDSVAGKYLNLYSKILSK
jgi:glycosyltransferase involved in cell wall biosynthesis